MAPFDSLKDNYKKIYNMYGTDYYLLSYFDMLDVSNVIKANEFLEKVVYGQQAPLIKEKNVDLLEERHDELMKRLCFFDYESYVDLDKIGAILVRPEVFCDRERYRQFLEKIKLDVIYEKKVRLSFEKYWILYHEQMMEGLRAYDPLTDFATRTFNYIHNDCYLYIVRPSESLNMQASNVAEYLFRYKGKQGYDIPNTLRGDIAYNSLLPYTENEVKLKNSTNIPLDPIGVYRALVRGEIYSDRCHIDADRPILFYGGQSVHIPDRYELFKDLNMFCDKEDAANLYLKIKKRED